MAEEPLGDGAWAEGDAAQVGIPVATEVRKLRGLVALLRDIDAAWEPEQPVRRALEACRRAFAAEGVCLIRLDAQGNPDRWWLIGLEGAPSGGARRLMETLWSQWAQHPPSMPPPFVQVLADAEGLSASWAALWMPLRDPWGATSLLALLRPVGFPFGEEDRSRLATAAEALALRLHHLIAFEQQRHLNRSITLLFRVARAIASSPDLTVTLPQVVRMVREETGWPRVAVLVYEPGSHALRVMAWEGPSAAADLTQRWVPVDRGITGRAFRTGEPQRVPDVREDPDYVAGNPTTRSELAVPIFDGGAPWGVVDAQSPEPYAFTPDDEALMLAIAATIALGLAAAQVYEQARQEQARVAQDRDRLIALCEACLALQQHPVLESALPGVVEAFVRLGWRAARCRIIDSSGEVLQEVESAPPPGFPPLSLAPWLSGEAVSVRDRLHGRLYRLAAPGPEAGGPVAIPLFDPVGRLLGLIELEPPGDLEVERGPLLRPTALLAALLEISLDRGRLLQQYQQRLREQTLLYRAVSALLRSGEPGPILTEIAVALCEALEGTSAYFVAFDFQERTAWIAAEYYTEAIHPTGQVSDLSVRYRWEDLPADVEALSRREMVTLYADDPPDRYEAQRRLLRRYGGWSVLVLPLFLGEEPLGVVEIWDSRRRRVFRPEERALAQSIAQHAALALYRARLHEQLALAHRRMEAIFATVEDGLILLDSEGRIVQMNPAARALIEGLGLRPEGPLVALLQRMRRRAPEAARVFLQALQRIRRQVQPGFRAVVKIPLGDGTRWFAVTCSAVCPETAGDPGGWLLALHDVTAEQERDRLREELIQMLMHDLQNPLGPIRMALEELSGLPHLEDPERSLVEMAQRGLRRLQNMISSLLDIARLESGRMPLDRKPVDLRALIDEAVEEWQALFIRRRVQVAVEASSSLPWVWLDRSLFSRVLGNLLSNAVKFTPVGGEVRLRVYPHEGMAVVEVFNSGSYIPPEHRERIFERFVAHPGSGGYGLGLTFSRLVVEAHGGRIEVESDARGTTFIVRVPLGPPGPPPGPGS